MSCDCLDSHTNWTTPNIILRISHKLQYRYCNWKDSTQLGSPYSVAFPKDLSCPILFLLFVNDLPLWIKNSIRMFADDTEVWKTVESDSDCANLQMDIDALLQWSEQWLLYFNPEKCKVMSLGHSLQYKYIMTGAHGTTEIARTSIGKDLGVHITDNLKWVSEWVVS